MQRLTIACVFGQFDVQFINIQLLVFWIKISFYGFKTGEVTANGELVITQPGGPMLTKKDWDDVINMPGYKLNLPVS